MSPYVPGAASCLRTFRGWSCGNQQCVQDKGSATPMKTRQSREGHSIRGRGACHPWRGDSYREHRGVDTEAGGSSHQQGYKTFTFFPALRFRPMSGPFVTPLKDISLSILISLGQTSRPRASLAPVYRKLAQADRADKNM